MAQRLLSQLAHVEVLTPTPQDSLDFYTSVLGLEESGRNGQSVFLRGWGEFFHHSIQLTEGPHAGLGHVGWRTQGPEELDRAVAILQQSGRGQGWHEEHARPRPRLSGVLRARDAASTCAAARFRACWAAWGSTSSPRRAA